MAIPIDFTTGLFLADTTSVPGTVLLPLTTELQGRTITIKDVAGNCGTNALTITTTSPDTFEHGGNLLYINQNYGFVTLTAGTNKWHTINATTISSIQTDSLFLRDTDLVATYYNVQISSGYILANGNYISTNYDKSIPPQLSTTAFTASSIVTRDLTVFSTLTAGDLYVFNLSTIANPVFTTFQLYDYAESIYKQVTISSGVLFFNCNVATTGVTFITPSTIYTSSFVVSSLTVENISAPYTFATQNISFPSPAGFSPSSISSLVAWYDAKDSTYVGYDGSFNVSTLADKSQSQANLQQDTGAYQPSYSPSNYIQFAGNQWLCNAQPTTYNNSKNNSIFFVADASQMNNAGILVGIPLNGLDRTSENGFGMILTSTTPSNITYFSQYPGNLYNPGSLSFYNTPRTSLSKATYNFTFDSSAMGYLFSNGTFFEKHLMSNNGTQPRGLLIGARGEDDAPATVNTLYGKVYEVLYYNRYLTTPERQKVEGYLCWKWGLENTLPLQHPFRFVSPSS